MNAIFICVLTNLLLCSLMVYRENYAVAVINFGAFLFCMQILFKIND